MKLYNTLGREKQALKPIDDDTVTFYACGPTVYDYAHLGNLRSYVFMDLLHRAMRFHGYDVELVVNITDVGHLTDDADQGEDKMEKSAEDKGKTVWEIADYYTKEFKSDTADLNIIEPDEWPTATEHIQEQIDLVKRMEENGYTYETSDGIYFDTSKLDDYGKLVPNFSPDKLDPGHRVEMKEKKNITDFALWKFSPSDEKRQMEWDSPWGRGFPGWHIECTAMACKYLGERFDIHTGGIDHIPVHHTNEIAQAQGAFGEDHVNYWLHCEFLNVESGKMSKSKGNFLRLQTVKDRGLHPLDYRYFLLQAHYRKPQTFSWEALESARESRKNLNRKILQLKEETTPQKKKTEYYETFKEAIGDDINIPKALSILHELLDSDVDDSVKLWHALEFDSVLGLQLSELEKEEAPEDVKELAEKRERYREDESFEKADELRKEIREKGWEVRDVQNGYELVKR